MAQEPIQTLVDALREEEEALLALLSTFQAEESAIAGNRVTELEGILVRQEELSADVRQAEQRRVQCILALSLAQGHSEPVTLSTIAEGIGGAWAVALHDLRLRLAARSEEIREASKSILFLLAFSAHTVDHILRILTGSKGTGPIYSRRGTIHRPSGNRTIINHQI